MVGRKIQAPTEFVSDFAEVGRLLVILTSY
jgi:hypothetical protein